MNTHQQSPSIPDSIPCTLGKLPVEYFEVTTMDTKPVNKIKLGSGPRKITSNIYLETTLAFEMGHSHLKRAAQVVIEHSNFET